MHHTTGAHDVATVRLTDRLVSEAHTQNGNVRTETLNEWDADSRLGWRARSWRDDDAIGSERCNIVQRNLIISAHDGIGAQLTNKLDQIECKRVVVVDDQNQR